MVEIIPTIIAKDFQELQTKVKKVEQYVDWVQLDVMDGQFVKEATWRNPDELEKLETDLQIEAHLMIGDLEGRIESWNKTKVKRIIFHFEATKNPEEIIKKIKAAGKEVGLAINPETPIEALDNLIEKLDLALIMAVRPGRAGQEFLKETLGKIKDLRGRYPDAKIEVDGGVNLETASEIVQAGANILASGSAVFDNPDIKETIEKFKKL